MDEARRQKAKEYEKIRHKLFLVNLGLGLVLLLAVFVFGGDGGLSGRLVRWIEGFASNRFLVVAVYAAIGIAAFSVLFLPLQFYSGYLLEHRFGLSTETLGGWFWDWIKSLAIDLAVSVMLIEAVYFFIGAAGDAWWIWAAAAWILFAVIVSQLFPVLILPLFYKLKKVENGELVERLVRLAEKVRAKVLGVFVMDMSRKTKKANAMLAGLGGTKRIILSDTLLEQFSVEEIEVVLGHELAHYHYRHIWKKVIVSSALGFAGLCLVHQILTRSLGYFGFRGLDDVANFPLFFLALSAFYLAVMPLDNTLSRRFERQCDRFALDQTKNAPAFISAMKKLAELNLANAEPNAVVEFLLHDHPCISKRIRMAEAFAAAAKSS